MEDERLVALDLDQLGEALHRRADVDIRIARVVEDAELPVDADVDAGGLDEPRIVWIDDDPAGRQLCLDGAVGQDHGDGSLVGGLVSPLCPKACPLRRRYVAQERWQPPGDSSRITA